MNLQQLQYFVTIAKCSSFSDAARRLYVAQPALSYSISSLEKELGTKLFSRDKRTVNLTPAGKVFYEEAVKILKQIDLLYLKVKNAAESGYDELHIGCLGFLLAVCFSSIISPFLNKHPDIKVMLEQDYLLPLHNRLENGELDIIITRSDYIEDTDTQNIRWKKLFNDSFMLLVPSNHPCAGMTSIDDLSIMENEPFIMVDPTLSAPLHQYIMKICTKRNYIPHVVFKPPSMDAVFTQVAAGMGISIVPYLNGHFNYIPGLRFIKLEGDDVRTDAVAAWSINNQNPAIKNFLEYLDEII